MKKDKKAVAVKYMKDIDVPIIMAKGDGSTADKIILEAKNSDVPVEEDRKLIDLIGANDVGTVVPENAWYALAKVFTFILDRK